MNGLQGYFVLYLKEYIKALTKGRREFFLSLCDIEEELLEELDVSELRDYQVIVVGKRDYSEAVRLRNNIDIQKIVLLSGEGVKHIDSLKDFNEYSVLSEERAIIWKCLEKVFNVQLNNEVKSFLEAILDQGEISLWELLRYLSKSMGENSIRPKDLNENLPMLGIWKSKEREILRKRQINRLIRYSKYAVIENRLTKAVMDRKIHKPEWEKIITNSLAQGSVQRILESIYYEEASDWLKSSGKGASGDGSSDAGSASEFWHGFSYEYKLKQHSEENVMIIENKWLQGRNDEEIEVNWDYYQPLVEDIQIYQTQIGNIVKEIEQMILPDREKNRLLDKVNIFWTHFSTAWDEILRATPMCLNTFCIQAEPYTKDYMELLSLILVEPHIRTSVSGLDFVEDIQTLFCEKRQDKIKMPYYHPICIFYYMCIQKIYDAVLQETYAGDIGALEETIQAELIQKIGLQFPINMISLSGKDGAMYALDRTTVWQSKAVEFVNIGEELTYSVLDFRVIQKQILEYIYKHPFLSVITIALIDISDLDGIEQLASKIRKLALGDRCNIGRIDFLILSSKEEELKKKLSQIWETFETKEMIHFRFGRNSYREKNKYDLQRIIEEADLTIIADSSVIYQEPRRERIIKERSVIMNRLTEICLEEQIQNYFDHGHSDISIMWASLQQAAQSREEGLWKWKSREIDNKILSFCNQMVDNYEDKEIVALTSNKSILSEIFMPRNMHAYRRKYNGKSVTIISLAGNNEKEKLAVDGEAQISYSLNGFYEAELELSDILRKQFPFISDVQLDFYFENNQMQCNCSIQEDERAEADEDWQNKCKELLCWQMGDFLVRKNILSGYFSELLINQWYEKTDCLPAVLLVEKLSRGGKIILHFNAGREITEKDNWDSLEAITIHEMIHYIVDKRNIDEKTINYVLEHYGEALLDKVIYCDNACCLLNQDEHMKLVKIQERIKEH